MMDFYRQVICLTTGMRKLSPMKLYRIIQRTDMNEIYVKIMKLICIFSNKISDIDISKRHYPLTDEIHEYIYICQMGCLIYIIKE